MARLKNVSFQMKLFLQPMKISMFDCSWWSDPLRELLQTRIVFNHVLIHLQWNSYQYQHCIQFHKVWFLSFFFEIFPHSIILKILVNYSLLKICDLDLLESFIIQFRLWPANQISKQNQFEIINTIILSIKLINIHFNCWWWFCLDKIPLSSLFSMIIIFPALASWCRDVYRNTSA